MNEFIRMMVRNRFNDLPLRTEEGEPRELPDDAVEYLLSIVEWAANKEASDALEAILNEFNLDSEDKDELIERINSYRKEKDGSN